MGQFTKDSSGMMRQMELEWWQTKMEIAMKDFGGMGRGMELEDIFK